MPTKLKLKTQTLRILASNDLLEAIATEATPQIGGGRDCVRRVPRQGGPYSFSIQGYGPIGLRDDQPDPGRSQNPGKGGCVGFLPGVN
jgi:hypothetical protein